MFAASADGNLFPPYVVYKAKNLYAPWIEGDVQGSHYNCTESGWFDQSIFEDWFLKIILPWVRRTNDPKVLIGDNLSSHVSLNIIKLCEQNNIRFVLLLPNSTHLCQPLDVAVFHPMKVSWRAVLEDWKLRNRGVLPKIEFPRQLRKALEKTNVERQQANIKSGFRLCGIYPLDRESVLKKLPSKMRLDELSSASEVSWTAAFVDQLEKFRTLDKTSKPRGKKLNVTAGRSLTEEDLQEAKKDVDDVAPMNTDVILNSDLENQNIGGNHDTGREKVSTAKRKKKAPAHKAKKNDH